MDQPAPSWTGRARPRRWREAAALAGLFALAAVLRFGALGWGLRHAPHIDERYFVENVGWMLAHRDLDHRFDEYPGLFFYALTPVLAWFDPPRLGPDSYLAARAVVAAFGVASVGLVYVLGVRLGGYRTGLVAALLLAVSPVEVQTAHMVRPDIALECFVLSALLAMTRVGMRSRDDLRAGAWMGAAAAIKFTGGLLVPSYLARRLTTPGPRGRGVVLAGAAALVAFALCSPHTILDLQGGVAGLATQVGYHYDVRPRGEQSFAAMALTYGLVLVRALGAVAVALALIGVVLARREWRQWLPLWLFPLTIVAVFSTAEVHHARFVVPMLGVVALCAGEAARRIGGRWAWALALVAAAGPLESSVDYVRGIRQPSTRDLALDRIDATVPAGATVVTTVTDLGLSRERYHVLPTVGLDEERARLLADHADVVAAQPIADDALLRGLRTLEVIAPPNRHSGPPLALATPIQRARYEAVDMRSVVVTASESADRVAALVDGDPATWWSTAGPQGGNWIDVLLPRPVRIGRVELRVPGRGRLYGRNIHVLVQGPEGQFRRVPVVSGLPPVDPGGRAGARQLLIFAPVVASRVRLAQVAEAVRPWGVAELRIDRRVDEAAATEVITSSHP